GIDFLASISRSEAVIRYGIAVLVALDPRQSTVRPSPVETGDHSIVSPLVIEDCCALPATLTFQMCRRSTSSWLDEKRMLWRSGVKLTSSTSKSPGVSSVACPPALGMAYKWLRFVCSETNTMRSSAKNSDRPANRGRESRRVLPLFQ